jgi:hypothetical protein
MRKLFQLKWWQYQKRQRTWSQNALRRAEPTLQSLHCAETLEVRGLLSASGFSGLTDCLDTQLDPIDHLIHLPNGEATKPYLYVSANLLDPKILAAITALATSETGPGAAVGGLAGFVGGRNPSRPGDE